MTARDLILQRKLSSNEFTTLILENRVSRRRVLRLGGPLAPIADEARCFLTELLFKASLYYVTKKFHTRGQNRR